MFVNDRPIDDKKDDRLSRSNFSTNLAKSIIRLDGREPTVLSLHCMDGESK